MAKSSHSKIACATPHNDTQRKVTKPSTDGKAASKPASNRQMKGWGPLNHSPDQSKKINGDPKDPKNIIHGKRTRKGSRMNESQLGNIPLRSPINDDVIEISTQRVNAQAASPTASRKHKDRASARSIEEPVPDTDSDNGPLARTEEYNTEDKVSAAKLHSSILALLNHSFQVTDDVLAYMQHVLGHEAHAQELQRDVDEVLTERGKKRKSSKNVRFAA